MIVRTLMGSCMSRMPALSPVLMRRINRRWVGRMRGSYRTRASRRQLQLVAHPNDAHLRDSHHAARYGAHETVNSAGGRESDNDVGADSIEPGCESSPTEGGNGHTQRRHRRRSSSLLDAVHTTRSCVVVTASNRTHSTVRVRSNLFGTARELRILQPMDRCGQVGASKSFSDR